VYGIDQIMKLKIVISETNGIAFLRLEGELIAGEEESAFRDGVAECIVKGRSSVVCDMAELY
jgi:hypothetical protein